MFHTLMHKQELERVLIMKNHHVQVLLMVGTQDLAMKKLQVIKMSEHYKFSGMELQYMMEVDQVQIQKMVIMLREAMLTFGQRIEVVHMVGVIMMIVELALLHLETCVTDLMQ